MMYLSVYLLYLFIYISNLYSSLSLSEYRCVFGGIVRRNALSKGASYDVYKTFDIRR